MRAGLSSGPAIPRVLGPARIGVLGAGAVVRALHLPVLKALPDADVRWICDVDIRSAQQLAKTFGIRTACSSIEQCPVDVDIVLVAIPVGFRRPATTVLTDRGHHAFFEKPFASSEDEHRWVLAKARTSRSRLGVALVRRFYGTTALARQIIASGVLGEIRSVTASEGSRIQRTGRDENWYQASAQASGGGALRETGSHVIDQVLTICDVRAFAIEECRMTKHEGIELDTVARGRLDLASGDTPIFRLEVSRLRDVYNGIVIHGRNGELRIGLAADSAVEIAGPDRRSPVRLRAEGPSDALSAFAAEWQRFLLDCREGPDFTDEDTGLMTTVFTDACYAAGDTSSGASSS